MRFQEEIGVAVLAGRLVAALAAILIDHLMLRRGAVVCIALLAMRLTAALVRPAVVMRFGGLRAAGAGAFVGAIVHIRPVVGMRRFVLFRVTTGAGVVMGVAAVGQGGSPVMAERRDRSATEAACARFCAGGGSDMRFQEEIGVAMIAAWLMPAFAAILIPHLMLGDCAVIMIALFAMGLTPAG